MTETRVKCVAKIKQQDFTFLCKNTHRAAYIHNQTEGCDFSMDKRSGGSSLTRHFGTREGDASSPRLE